MNGAVLAGCGDETNQGQWVEAGVRDCRQLAMSGATSSAVRKSRYLALKKHARRQWTA